MRINSLYILSFLLIFLCSCEERGCPLPENYKTECSDIAFFAERQGMVTYDVNLREDGKYICIYDYFPNRYTYGTFDYTIDTLYLFDTCDEPNWLCNTYFIDSTADIGGLSLAIPLCDTTCKEAIHEEMWFDWGNY